jgi:hypothetical protein
MQGDSGGESGLHEQEPGLREADEQDTTLRTGQRHERRKECSRARHLPRAVGAYPELTGSQQLHCRCEEAILIGENGGLRKIEEIDGDAERHASDRQHDKVFGLQRHPLEEAQLRVDNRCTIAIRQYTISGDLSFGFLRGPPTIVHQGHRLNGDVFRSESFDPCVLRTQRRPTAGVAPARELLLRGRHALSGHPPEGQRDREPLRRAGCRPGHRPLTNPPVFHARTGRDIER